MSGRHKNVYFAKLHEHAERYDEMADHMNKTGEASDELYVEERNVFSALCSMAYDYECRAKGEVKGQRRAVEGVLR